MAAKRQPAQNNEQIACSMWLRTELPWLLYGHVAVHRYKYPCININVPVEHAIH